jgi:ABC-type lipoprotein export system ATPase subunit
VPRLRAEGVCFAYPGTRDLVVSEWNHDFRAKTVTALTGPSGSGKSTRLYLLALMVRLQRGRVLLDGERVDDLSDASRSRLRAHRFGFIFQDAALDPTRTVRDNVLESALYRGEDPARYEERARELLDRMKVSVPLRRRPGQVSGGQAQRIAVCRAVIGAPDVVFADEPTGNLDPDSARAVLTMLREQAEAGACVIVVTHDPDVAAWADEHTALSASPG